MTECLADSLATSSRSCARDVGHGTCTYTGSRPGAVPAASNLAPYPSGRKGAFHGGALLGFYRSTCRHLVLLLSPRPHPEPLDSSTLTRRADPHHLESCLLP